MSDTRRPLTVDEFELLVSQVIIPNRWKGAEPLTERQIRKVGNNAHWENVLVEVSQVTRDNYHGPNEMPRGEPLLQARTRREPV